MLTSGLIPSRTEAEARAGNLNPLSGNQQFKDMIGYDDLCTAEMNLAVIGAEGQYIQCHKRADLLF